MEEISDADLAMEGVDRDDWAIQDADAREYVGTATEAVVSLVRSTLGPYGMEKLIETHDAQNEPETVLTADADEILAAVERGEGFNHPVAALFVDGVDSMQRALGDGTATSVVLAGELVANGLDLVADGAHPGSVVVGYSMAANRAGSVLDELARACSPTDRELLESVAATSMTSDRNPRTRRRNAAAVVDAIEVVSEASEDGFLDPDDVQVLAGTGVDSALHRGHVVRRPPTTLETDERSESEFDPTLTPPREDATAVVFDDEIDFEETSTPLGIGKGQQKGPSGATLRTADAARQYHDDLDERRRAFASRLADLGVDVLVTVAETSDAIENALATEDVTVIDQAKYPREDVHRLARALDAQVVSRPEDVTPDVLGNAGRYEERLVDGEKWCLFTDCPGGIFSLHVGADTATGATERERLVEDAIEVTTWAAVDEQVLPGGGAAAAAVASDLRSFAPGVEGREQLAVEAFADALDGVVATLARNAGRDAIEAVTALRSAHADGGPASIGFDLDRGEPVDAYEAGVVEPRRVFSQSIETARSVTEQLLTIDAVLFPHVDFDDFSPETEHG